MPAAAGVDTTSVLLGDYSNGNDAVITRQNLTLAQILQKLAKITEKQQDEVIDLVRKF